MNPNLLTVRINARNFTTQPIKPVDFKVKRLAWTAYGGPDQATITAQAPYERLLDFVSLLRCALTVQDHTADPVWWGYINKIEIKFHHVNFYVSLDDLFNKVKVLYSYVSPSNQLADLYETGFASSAVSQLEYGIKERVLYRQGIDDDFALALRDTFLEVSSFPRSQLKPSAQLETPTITIHCRGWFHTLGWRFYENSQGYYANHGPGPGGYSCGDTVTHGVAQRFYVAQSSKLKYVHLLLRRNNSPTSNTYVRVFADSGATRIPDTSSILAQSDAIAGSTFKNTIYGWEFYSFASAYTLSAATWYWIYFYPNTSHASNYYIIRTDENSNFNKVAFQYTRRYDVATSTWLDIANATHPNMRPHLYHRIVCVEDTGTLLYNFATATSEFFTGIQSLTSGIVASPYRVNGLTTLQEIQTLMKLGTSNQRPILANVSVDRRLRFYEAPNPAAPTAYLDPHGRFFTANRTLLPAWRPPIGQYAMLSGVDRLTQPFDLKRTPAYFVDRYVYTVSQAKHAA